MNSSTSTYAFSVGKGISHGILKALHTSKQPLKEERTHSISFLEQGAAMWPILTYYLSSLSGRLTRKKTCMLTPSQLLMKQENFLTHFCRTPVDYG